MWIGAMLVSIREITLGLPPNSLKKQAIQINILEIITLVFGNRIYFDTHRCLDCSEARLLQPKSIIITLKPDQHNKKMHDNVFRSPCIFKIL
jgi:hypothetical protein